MNWTLIAPSYKYANLHQNAFALAFGGNASATNVGVLTVG